MKMNTSKNFYIGIKNAREFRRETLEASRNAISILKSYQKIVLIRKQKLKLLNKLKNDLKEINSLVKHLDTGMPDMGLRAHLKKVKEVEDNASEYIKKEDPNAVPVIEEQNVEVKKPSKPTPRKTPHKKTELELLEEQLEDIDIRLNEI